MYLFLRGPMVWISLLLFVVGMVIQGIRFYRMTRGRDPVFLPPPGGIVKKREKRLARVIRRLDDLLAYLKKSVLGSHPLMTVTTLIFHVFLIITPLLVLGHNTLMRESWGFGLLSLPEVLTDLMTIVVILCTMVFLCRRLFVRRVRAITSLYDIFVLLVTMAPFVTGFMAYRQLFDYKTVLLIHIVSGELMLILIPFSRLGHALFFFLYRFTMGSEYSFGQGRRAW